MPGATDLATLNNMLAGLEVRVTIIEGEVQRVLTELVSFLKEGGFRNIDQYVTL